MLKIVCIIPSLCSKQSLPNLIKCIDSLKIAQKLSNVELTITIVSNGKKLLLSGVRKKIDCLIKLEGEFNFAQMNNFAINKILDKSTPEWVLFINDDAWVEINFFKVFFGLVSRGRVDLLSPKVIKAGSSRIDSFGIEYFKSGYAKNSDNNTNFTSLATASVLMARVSFLEQVRLIYGYVFNPILTSYYEDVEFSIRALGLGGKIKKSEKLVAYHVGSFSSGFKSKYVLYQSYRNVLWVILLAWPIESIIRNSFSILVVQAWFFTHALIKFGPAFYIHIIGDTLNNLPAILRERKKIIASYDKSFTLDKYLCPHTFRMGRGTAF